MALIIAVAPHGRQYGTPSPNGRRSISLSGTALSADRGALLKVLGHGRSARFRRDQPMVEGPFRPALPRSRGGPGLDPPARVRPWSQRVVQLSRQPTRLRGTVPDDHSR